MSEIEHGMKVKDTITGMTGLVIATSEHLTGCSRIAVRPQDTDSPATRRSEEYFYPEQLEILDDERVGEFEVPERGSVELGCKVEDQITGLEGVAIITTAQILNCLQVCVQPIDSENTNEKPSTEWFDAPRLSVGEKKYDPDDGLPEETGAVICCPAHRKKPMSSGPDAPLQ